MKRHFCSKPKRTSKNKTTRITIAEKFNNGLKRHKIDLNCPHMTQKLTKNEKNPKNWALINPKLAKNDLIFQKKV